MGGNYDSFLVKYAVENFKRGREQMKKIIERKCSIPLIFSMVILLFANLSFNAFAQLTEPIGKIAFTECNHDEPIESCIDLWIVNPDGSNLKKLFDGVDRYGRVRFSPDGRYIAFKGRDGKHKIVDLEGNILHEFEGGERSGKDFSWSPDGRSIIFGAYFDGIYRYNLQGRRVEKVIDTWVYRTYDHNPVISPDLGKIVFTHHEWESLYWIYTADINGENIELITSGSGTGYDEHLNLNWLDNKHIIFNITNFPKFKLYYFNIETKKGKEIDIGISFLDTRLFPDKKTLAIVTGMSFPPSKLYFIDTAELSSDSVNFLDTGLEGGFTFAWSKDGKYFVINGKPKAWDPLNSSVLRIFDKSGKEYKVLKNKDFPEEVWYYFIKDVDWTSQKPVYFKDIKGACYSPFRDGQNPNWGPYPSENEIREDMLILKNMSNAIRTYGVTKGLEKIVPIANQFNLKASPGAWLCSNREANEEEINSLINLAKNYKVESVIVGNEVVLRYEKGWDTLTERELIDYISRVKEAVDVPVTTVEPWHIWDTHAELVNAVDYILVNIHPYWEGISIDEAANYVIEKYKQIQNKYPHKQVVIGETGWPSDGLSNGKAVPSLENQRRFVEEFLDLANKEGVNFYYFEAFDEKWKEESNNVGPHWGFYYSDRTPKHPITALTLVPDIKVNGSDGPLTVTPSDSISVVVALDNNWQTNNADWWLAADTPFGLWFFTFEGWTTDWIPAYQGPLFPLDSYEVLNMPVSGLPPGTYTLYFGVDTYMDRNVTWDSVYYDTVVVNITEANGYVSPTILWEKTFGGTDHDSGYSVQQTSDGGYIVVGATGSVGLSWRDIYLLKVDSQGNLVWEKTFGGTKSTWGPSIERTSDGAYVIVGGIEYDEANKEDVLLAKIREQ